MTRPQHPWIRTTLACALSLGAGSAGAQSPHATSPSGPLGATIVVVDSLDLRDAGGQSLAAFIAGRVPGLVVAYESGLPSSTPRVIARGTSGSYGSPQPLLYVDGVLWRDDPFWMDVDPWSARWGQRHRPPPSLGWGLPIEEVAEIRVALGAAGSAGTAFGASRGIVWITTHRPRAGVASVHASLDVSATAVPPAIGANVSTLGDIGGTPTDLCTLADQAGANCTPTQSVRWSHFDDLMPWRRGDGVRARVAGSTTLGGWHLRGSAVRELSAGTLPSAHADRTDLGASLAGKVGARADVSLDGRYALSRGRLAGWGGAGLAVGSAYAFTPDRDVALAGFSQWLDATRNEVPRLESDRLVLGASTRVRLGAATTVEVRGAIDETRREGRAVTSSGPAVDLRQSSDLASHGRELSVTASDRRSLGRELHFSSLVGVTYHRTATVDEYRAVVPGPWVLREGRRPLTVEAATIALATRATFRDRAMIGAGLRREGLVQQGDAPLLASAEAGWEVFDRQDGHREFARLRRLTVRGAYGESVDHRSTFGEHWLLAGSLPLERTYERELALDAEWSARVSSTVALTSTGVTGGTLFHRAELDPALPDWVRPEASWRTDAALLRIAWGSVPQARVRWHGEFTALARRTRLQRVRNDNFCIDLNLLAGIRCHEAGRPLDEIQVGTVDWSDANSDDIITPAEVVPYTGLYHRNAEAPWILAARGAVDLARGVSLGLVLESHLGHEAIDEIELARCYTRTCRALHDGMTPVQEQAYAIALSTWGQNDGFVHDASFVRLRELTVGFTPAVLRGGRVRLSVHQLLVWTRFPGNDPEAIQRLGAISRGSVGPAIPITPSISLRIDVAR